MWRTQLHNHMYVSERENVVALVIEEHNGKLLWVSAVQQHSVGTEP